MNEAKQAFELIEQSLAIRADMRVGRFADKPQFANEMSQAKLDGDGRFFI